MHRRRSHGVSSPESLSIAVVSWNVGNEQPFPKRDDESLDKLIPEAYDLLVMGVQEASYRLGQTEVDKEDEEDEMDKLEETEASEVRLNAKQKKKSGSSVSNPKHLDKLIAAHVAKFEMVTLKVVSFYQMKIMMFVKKSLKTCFTKIKIATEATGLLGVYGNKGAVGISLLYQGSRLTFMNCHLAAHLPRLYSRNSDVKEILGGTHIFDRRLDITLQSDHVFWFGDMNYRLDLDYQPGVKPVKVKVGSDKHNEQHQRLNQMIAEQRFSELMQYDQLHQEMARGAIFYGFKEMDLNFEPTFKVKRERQISENDPPGKLTIYSDIRMPSYCDRVLYRSMPALEENLTPVNFTSVPEVFTSDHKPVRATFLVKPLHLPEKFSSPSHNSQIVFSDLECTDGGMEDRVGVYLIFTGYPSSLTSSLVSKSQPRAKWADSFELRLKVRPFEEKKLHMIISVLDDKIGADETCGDAIVSVWDVVQAPDRTLRFTAPLIHNGTNTGAVLRGTAHVIRQGETGFFDWSKRKKFRGRSVFQMV